MTWAVKDKLCQLIPFSETLDRRLQRAEKVFQGRVTGGLLRQASAQETKTHAHAWALTSPEHHDYWPQDALGVPFPCISMPKYRNEQSPLLR